MHQCLILGVGIGDVVCTLQLNPYRKVVALLLTPEARPAGMPGPVQQADELNRRTISANQQMGGHRHTGNGLKVGMRGSIKLIAEKPLYGIATKLPWRQADVVNHQQGNGGAFRARAEIG